jgi:hypothetical protein
LIGGKIPELTDCLEVGNLRTVVVGGQDEEEYYRKVMEAAQNNRRNSPEYAHHILSPLVALIKEQRAKL